MNEQEVNRTRKFFSHFIKLQRIKEAINNGYILKFANVFFFFFIIFFFSLKFKLNISVNQNVNFVCIMYLWLRMKNIRKCQLTIFNKTK